jgi:hypothetical protein
MRIGRMTRIWHLIRRGWRLMAEVHLATWLIEVASQIPAFGLGIWAWAAGLPGPIIAATVLVVSAAMFVTALAFSGYRYHPAAGDASSSEIDRVPLIQLRDMVAQVGWNTNVRTSDDAYEFASRLNQAAVDGKIKFWGRKYVYDFSRPTADYPLLEIPLDHFKDYSFDSLRLFGSVDNFHIYTGKLGKSPRELRGHIYQDPHVDSRQLSAWIDRNKKNV